jgi:hypothetical protein
MRKIIAYILLAAMTLSMVACGSAEPENTTPPSEAISAETEPTETNPIETEPTETESTESTTTSNQDDAQFIVGNMQFMLLDGMSAEEIDDNLFLITLVPGKAYASMYANDMSNSNLATVESFVEIQHLNWTGDVEEKLGETDFASKVGGFEVAGESYATYTDGNKLTGCLDFSFTDTWVVYTFMYFCYPTDENDSYNMSFKYGALLATATYLGDTPRTS